MSISCTRPVLASDKAERAMRLGIFGGTFDPVHYGHLLLAESCREQLRLDQVWFMPAAVPPHKQERTLTAAAARVEMLELAIGGHPGLAVSQLEIARGGISYTVETLAQLKAEQPEAELFFLVGADSLRDLPTWREPARICELAALAVVDRAQPGETGAPPLELPSLELAHLEGILTADQLQATAANRVSMPRIDLSSSDIRARVATGRSIRYRTPRAVEKYIEAHSLYR